MLLNVSTGHSAKESRAQPDPEAKTAPLHHTQLLPRGGWQLLWRAEAGGQTLPVGLQTYSLSLHLLPDLGAYGHATGILLSPEVARWKGTSSGLGTTSRKPACYKGLDQRAL